MKKTNNYSIIDERNNLQNYKLFNNSKFLEIVLNKNEYLYIPSNWPHWVFTKENTLAFSYSIEIHNEKKNNNKLLQNISKKIPYYNKLKNFEYEYNNFILNNLENKFNFCYGNSFDITAVNKRNVIKKTEYLMNIHNEIIENKFIYYSPSTTIFDSIDGEFINFKNQEFLKEIPNFSDINNYCDINYHIKSWFNFYNSLSSGLHFDDVDNILLVLDGQKIVYLSHPKNKKYLYIVPNKYIKNI